MYTVINSAIQTLQNTLDNFNFYYPLTFVVKYSDFAVVCFNYRKSKHSFVTLEIYNRNQPNHKSCNTTY